MRRLDDSGDPVWIKAAIYGKPGTGKTSLGVTAPKPLILLSEAQGLVHVRQAAKRLGVPVPPTFFIETMEDYRNWHRALRGDRSKPLVLKERHKNPQTQEVEEIQVLELADWPETVVVDSLTEAANLIVNEIRWLSPPKKGQDGLPVDSQRFWNVLSDKFRALVYGFRDLPMHTLFLGLSDDRSDGDDDAKVRNLTMDLPMRKLPALVSSAVNVVGYSYRKEVRAANKPTQLQYGVMTTGPEYMMLKPFRPLRDSEVSNFSKWVDMVRGQLIELPPAPEPSEESSLSLDLEAAKAATSEAAEPESAAAPAEPEATKEPEPQPKTEKKTKKEKKDSGEA